MSDSNGSATIVRRSAAINQWDDGFQRLVTQTVLKPKNRQATGAELALLAEHAVRTGLDPMARQIYGVYRYDKRAGGEVMTLQVGIDGLRTIAERTGAYLGQIGPFWCGADGQWREVWLEREPPRAAKVIVRKLIAGQVAETPAIAHWDEYVPLGRDGKPSGLWPDKPALMLAKCAEALALRKAFPHDMAGLYVDEEMQRADAQAPSVAVAQRTDRQAETEDEPVDAQVVDEAPRVTARAPQAAERPATGKQRGLINARAGEAGLTPAQLANVVLEAAGQDRRTFDGDEQAQQFVNRQLDRLPARLVDAVLEGIKEEGEEQ